MVRYKDEPGACVAQQCITATSAIEALAVGRAMYGNLLFPNAVFSAGSCFCSAACSSGLKNGDLSELDTRNNHDFCTATRFYLI